MRKFESYSTEVLSNTEREEWFSKGPVMALKAQWSDIVTTCH